MTPTVTPQPTPTPSSILRFITFVTHARGRGCVPVKVLCSNPCRQYCKSVWLEYKTPAELDAQVRQEAASSAFAYTLDRMVSLGE